MERTRTTLLLLSMGLVLMIGGNPSLAASAAADQTPAAPAATAADQSAAVAPIAAAGETPCTSCLKCPCGCSPLAGAWVAKLSSKSSWWTEETIIQTFKFAPVNDGCTKFVVNSQAATRSAKVGKFWPDACDQTEFVGIACKDEWKDMKLTAISYGVQRCITTPRAGGLAVAGKPCDCNDTNTNTCPTTTDKVVFIAIMTAKIEIPESCLQCGSTGNNSSDQKSSGSDGKDAGTEGKYTGDCMEPKELKATIYVSYFDASQDVDRDGFPDCKCEEAVLCVCYETCLKRVEQMEPCAESRSFKACLGPCENVSTAATGQAFFRILEGEEKVCFVLTANGLKDVKKATLQVNGAAVVTLFPFPPDTKSKDGDCNGLLSCGCFYVKDCVGSWKGKKLADIVKAIGDGQATVVVVTAKFPNGEIRGTVEDP